LTQCGYRSGAAADSLHARGLRNLAERVNLLHSPSIHLARLFEPPMRFRLSWPPASIAPERGGLHSFCSMPDTVPYSGNRLTQVLLSGAVLARDQAS
jgi:hypothetical protein